MPHDKEFLDAAGKGDIPAMKKYLSKGANLTAKTEYGYTALMMVATCGHLQAAQWLVDHMRVNIEETNTSGDTALLVALQKGHFLLAKWFVEDKHMGLTGQKPLYRATCSDNVELMAWLVDKRGVSLAVKDEYDAGPLLWTAISGKLETLKWLVEIKRLSLTAEKDKDAKTAFLWAARAGHLHVLKWIYSVMPTCLHDKDNEGNTALLCAIEGKHFSVAEWLVKDMHVELNEKDHRDWTALMSAAYTGQVALVRLLIENGAKREEVDKHNRNALSLAKEKNHTDIVNLLNSTNAQTFPLPAAQRATISVPPTVLPQAGAKTSSISAPFNVLPNQAGVRTSSVSAPFNVLPNQAGARASTTVSAPFNVTPAGTRSSTIVNASSNALPLSNRTESNATRSKEFFDVEKCIKALQSGIKSLDLSSSQVIDLKGDYSRKFEHENGTITRLHAVPQRLICISYRGSGVADDGLIEVLDSSTGKRLWKLEGGASSKAVTILSGPLLAVGQSINTYSKNKISIIELESGKMVDEIKVDTDRTGALAGLSHDRLVSGHEDGSIRIWDVKKKKCIDKLKHHKESIQNFIVLPGERLISCSTYGDKKGFLQLWDITPGKCKHLLTFCVAQERYGSSKKDEKRYDIYEGSNYSAMVLLPGEVLVTSELSKVMFWDIKIGRCIDTFPAEDIQYLAYLRGPNLLVGGPSTTGNKGKTVVWNMNNKSEKNPILSSNDSLYNLTAIDDYSITEGRHLIGLYKVLRSLVAEDIKYLFTRLYLDKTALEVLNLSDIKFDHKTVESLCDCLKKQSQLKVLNITATEIPEKDVEKIYRDCLERNHKLEILHESIVAVRNRVEKEISDKRKHEQQEKERKENYHLMRTEPKKYIEKMLAKSHSAAVAQTPLQAPQALFNATTQKLPKAYTGKIKSVALTRTDLSRTELQELERIKAQIRAKLAF